MDPYVYGYLVMLQVVIIPMIPRRKTTSTYLGMYVSVSSCPPGTRWNRGHGGARELISWWVFRSAFFYPLTSRCSRENAIQEETKMFNDNSTKCTIYLEPSITTVHHTTNLTNISLKSSKIILFMEHLNCH